jgi:hypothetical protein
MQDLKFPFLCITICHFCGLVCMLNNCHIIPLSTYYPQPWTFHSPCPQLHNCSIQFSGVSHWSAYLIMKLHCKVHQSIEKYLLWDETLLPTPGKVGIQLCSRSSRSIILSRAAGCTVYLYTPHHPFLKFPVYILWTCHCDACLCDLPDIVICRHLLCTPVTCAGTPFSQMGLWWKDQWGMFYP